MCRGGELPVKRSGLPFSTIVSLPKSTHYENWTGLPKFCSPLKTEITTWEYKLDVATRKLQMSCGAGMKGRCVCEVKKNKQTVKLSLFHNKHKTPCFFPRVFQRVCCKSALCCMCTFVCSTTFCVCVWKQQDQELREWQRVCGGQKLKPSDLILGVSCLPAVTVPLASYSASCPPPAPFEDSYPGNWKLFSKEDKRGEKSTDSGKKRSVKRVMERL